MDTGASRDGQQLITHQWENMFITSSISYLNMKLQSPDLIAINNKGTSEDLWLVMSLLPRDNHS